MDKPAELARSKRLALGLLLLVTAVFVLTSWLPRSLGVDIVKAMAEAAMVGAMADWFAVVALFRYPCGIPIPHTALVPNNQDRIATNLGKFVENNFVDPDEISAKLAGWLGTEGRLEELAGPLAAMVPKPMRESLTGRLVATARDLIDKYRKDIAAHTADVVRGWDPKQMADTIEDYVGSDLQYIRLNGTFVGGLAGFVLFWAQHFLRLALP